MVFGISEVVFIGTAVGVCIVLFNVVLRVVTNGTNVTVVLSVHQGVLVIVVDIVVVVLVDGEGDVVDFVTAGNIAGIAVGTAA